jgi:hypothetical protein
MAKLDGDDQTVAGRWGQEMDFAQRSAAAGIDDCMRGIIRDGLSISSSTTQLPPRPLPASPSHLPEPEVVPSFREWAHLRLGVDWPEDRAKDYYDTLCAQGRDVGPLRPASPSLTPADPKALGVVTEPLKTDWQRSVGVPQLDRMMEHQDALDRAERAKNGGRW